MTIRYSTDYDPNLLPRIVGELVQAVNSEGGDTSVEAFAGGGQTDATALSNGANIVTVVASKGDSVKMPSADTGRIVSVVNDGANLLSVYPGSGDQFNGSAANAALPLSPSVTLYAICLNSGYWANSSNGESVVDLLTNQDVGGSKRFTGELNIAPASLLASNEQQSLTANAVTLADLANAAVITTEALTTAAGASQAFTLTSVGIGTADICLVQDLGGTNTRQNFRYKAVCTTDTITVTVYNTEPTNAINGTLKFAMFVVRGD